MFYALILFFVATFSSHIISKQEPKILAEGKTKIICTYEDQPDCVRMISKDVITAGDGAKRDALRIAEANNDTICSIFELLNDCGIKTHFIKKLDATSLLVLPCNMILYEVVVRRVACGSYCKRRPDIVSGYVFPHLIVEFFLKTTDKVWQGQPIPCDDPYMIIKEDKAHLYRPDQPIFTQQPFLTLDDYPCKNQPECFKQMADIAHRTFLILEKAWQTQGSTLVDFKVEFGFDAQGNLLLADDITNGSWRVIHNGKHIDKQVYRNGGDLNTVETLYYNVRDRVRNFAIPQQQIIVWRASEQDDIEPIKTMLQNYAHKNLTITYVTMSLHKNPIQAYSLLNKYLQATPDSVIIALVGRSNGAGPLLTSFSTTPVITIPATGNTFPEDVWSSLRMPREVPVMTVMEPQNAVLAALRILSKNNPCLYAQLRAQQETKLVNIIEIN